MRTILLAMIGFSSGMIARSLLILVACRRFGHNKQRRYSALSASIWVDYCARCGTLLDSHNPYDHDDQQ